MLLGFYIVGGLLAWGMLIGGGFVKVAIQELKKGYDIWDKIKIFFWSLGLFALAFILSWVAVGFIYMESKDLN